MRAVIEKNESREAKGTATYGLAQIAKDKSESVEGEAHEKATQEAEALFQEVVDHHGDLKPFADMARRELYHIHHFAIGMEAPEIEADDLDGKTFKLSDYRGKVVVLDFWSDWSASCWDMYPRERLLVKKLAGRPFVLLGINGDVDREQVKNVIEEKGITWRSWWDRGSVRGPIASAWNVRSWPTLYVIDHKGTIRHKYVRFPGEEKFDGAIESLLKEAEKGAETPAGTPGN
jgi:peroxiredoxin